MSNNLQPETRGRWTGWRGTYLEAQGGGWRKEIGGSPGEGEEGGLILRQAQPRRRRWDPRSAGSFRADSPAALGGGGAGKAKAAARAYPVDLGQPPLLPGFEQTERFPSWRRQRGGRGSGGLPGPRALGSRPLPARGRPHRPPRAHRWRAGDTGCGQGRGTAWGQRRLPWNLLLSATDMVSTGLPPARGFATAARTRRRGGRLVRARAACGGGTEGRRDGAGGRTLPSLPPLPTRLPSPPLPAARHQSGYYAGRRARRRPLCWRTRKMHGAGAACEHLPLRSCRNLDQSLPARGRGFPLNRPWTTLVRTSWDGYNDQMRVPAAGSCNVPFAFCAARTFGREA